MFVTFSLLFLRITRETSHSIHRSLGVYSPLNSRFHIFLARFLVVYYKYLLIMRRTNDTIHCPLGIYRLSFLFALFPIHIVHSIGGNRLIILFLRSEEHTSELQS